MIDTGIHEARGDDLDDWDARAVDPPGGHVYQSRAWAEVQARSGWRTRFLRFDDGFPVLVLQRRWPWIGGWSAYVSRGPVPTEAPDRTAQRQIAVGEWLGRHAVDVVAADPEVPAAASYAGLIRAAGYRPIEELQPSRHRMRLSLEGVDEAAAFSGLTKQTRQRVRKADGAGLEIVRHDARGPSGAADDDRAADGDRAALDAFYDLLRITGQRRGFTFGSRDDFVGWWSAAQAAGHLVHLEARADGRAIAGLVLYRHGGRLSTVHSADLESTRATHPGVLHLLRWRAIQIAIAEHSSELDFGGADVPGARRPPRDGEPLHGLYEHKRSFGAEWVELAGAHELVIRRARYVGGRIAQRLSRELARRR